MNSSGPVIGRDANRTWVLIALIAIVALAFNPPLKIEIQQGDRPTGTTSPDDPSDRAGRAAAAPGAAPATSPGPADSPPGLADLPSFAGLAPPPADTGPLGLLAAPPFAGRSGATPEIPRAAVPIDPPATFPPDPNVVRTAGAAGPLALEGPPGSGPPPALSPAPSPVPAPAPPPGPASPTGPPAMGGPLALEVPPGSEPPPALSPSPSPAPETPAEPLAFPMPDLARSLTAAGPSTGAPSVGLPGPDRAPAPSEPPVAAPPALSPDPRAPAAAAGSTAEDVADRSPAHPDHAARSEALLDALVEPTGCAACGGFHSIADGPVFHDMMGGPGGQCIPGRQPCNLPFPDTDSVLCGALNNLYQCLCCPDPCYQPRWEPAANASFFADYARPRTVTRLRYDNLENLVRPDRNQFWIMQAQTIHSYNRPLKDLYARLQQVYIYQEAAGERGSFFIEYPYRQINPSYEPTQAGFGDMNFGVKSLFFDCELLQLTFQFRTYAPTGNSQLGLGTGHFSLDPSILAALKLGPDTYLQGQYGNWIPLGGNSKLAGGVFYWLTSLNQVLWYVTPDSPLIATLELDGWSFENGGYTGAIRPGNKPHHVEKGGGVSYFNIGPGLRQSICNRMDIGGAITWATSSVHWAQPWFRFEVRFLF